MTPQPTASPRLSIGFAWSSYFVFLTLLIGFRYEVGGDWFSYLDYVEALQGDALMGGDVPVKDPLYWLLNWLGANVVGGIYTVNFICAIFFSWGLITFCRAQPRAWLALLVATPYLITVVAMGYTRQGVAIGLGMLAITYLMNGSLVRFIGLIVVAALFHKSAVILIPISLFAKSKNRVLTTLGISISMVIFFALILQEHVDGLVTNYIEAEYTSSGAAIRIAMSAIPAVLFLIFKKRFNLDSKICGFWIWMAWGALLLLVLLLISPSSTAIDRVALYAIPLQIFVLSRLPDALGVSNKRNSPWVFLIIIYCVAIMITWLFFGENSLKWLPYRFFPWEALWI